MFTGIVENVGEVTSLEEKKDSWLLQIKPLLKRLTEWKPGRASQLMGAALHAVKILTDPLVLIYWTRH